MLFSWMPVPGITNPEVTPFEVVIAATIPSPSTALQWVVPVVANGVNAPDRRWAVASWSVPSSRAHPRRHRC